MQSTAKAFLYLPVLAAMAAGQNQIPVKANPIEISARNLSGRRAPSFALPDLSMKQYDILDYRGRWLLIAYIKPDAPESREVLKKLEGVKAHLGGKPAVLAIVVPPDNTVTVSRLVTQTKTTTPILFDSGQTAMWYFKATPQRPSVDSPHVFAISPQGMIVRDWNQAQVQTASFAAEVEAVAAGAAGAGAGKK